MKMYKSTQVACFAVVMFLALGVSQYARAQNYQVGIPVCDTIVAGSEFGACAPYDILRFGLGSSLIPYVTGLSFQIVISEANGRIWSDLSDTVKVGDILPIPVEVDSGVKVFFAISSSFKFIVRIVGTPMVPNESYYCEIKYGHTTMVCGNTLGLFGTGTICQVQPATAVEEKEATAIPAKFQLLQNYPNPFNPQTTIKYTLPKLSHVKLVIYDMLGQEVRMLVKEFQQTGFKAVVWDGRNNRGQLVPSGVYIYRLVADGFTQASKSLLLR